MPSLLIRNPDGTEQERSFDGELTVGRAEGNDLVLAEGGVSRRHARFFTEGSTVLVEDVGSANGTFVDGEKVEGPTPVQPKAQVVIGDYEFSLKPMRRSGARKAASGEAALEKPRRATRMLEALEAEGAAAARHSRPSIPEPVAPEGAGPMLRGLTGPWLNKLYPIDRVLVLGRVPGVDVQIEDDSVSRRHAEVEKTPQGVVIRDLGSANGTLVNGAPVTQETPLRDGDVVQLGVIELVVEGAGLAPPRRRGSGMGLAAGEAGPGASRKRILVVAGAVVGLMVIAGGLKALVGSTPASTPPLHPSGGPVAVAPDDQAQELDRLLTECRGHAATDGTQPPDWGKAEAACDKALALEPIHPEANQLLRRIRAEREAFDHFQKGEKALTRLREAEALEEFGRIPQESFYYFKAKPKIQEALAGVMKSAAADCKRYAGNRHWSQALPRCETYMKFACQSMKPEELRPAANQTLSLSGRLKKNQWRPKDPMYLRFLQVREKVDPGAPVWKCPEMKILRTEQVGPDPKAEVRKALQGRFGEPSLQKALELYFDGKGGDAVVLLQKLRERQEKAPYHAQADELRKDISNVEQLYKEGEADLQSDEPEKAAEPFREVLAVDKKLMADTHERNPSYYRRSAQQNMASKAYEQGKHWADRKDYRKACRMWKLGFEFYRGNPELLRALGNICSHNAAELIEKASTCEDLPKVLEFAVDGDGIREKVEARKTEWQCK